MLLGFATRELTPHGTVRIHPRWGRISLLLFGLLLLLWGLKSFALFYFFRQVREFEDVAFSDMILFPMNRTNVRIQQGNYQIELGMAALEREDYRRAYLLLREGVIRSPGNLQGRMLLSQIYSGWRPDLAVDLLAEGLPYGKHDPPYIQLMCRVLLNQKKDELLLELTEPLLEEKTDPVIHQTLSVARLQSALYRGRFELLQNLFEETNLKYSLDGVIWGARLYQQTDRPSLAIEVLLSVLSSGQTIDLGPVYNELVSVYKETGAFDRARETALEQVIGSPLDWQPRIVLIDVLAASGHDERRDREINALIQQHRETEEAMIALSRISAQYGLVATASRLYEIALENGYQLGLFSLTLVEACVVGGQYQRAVDLSNELVREDTAWLDIAESSFNAIRSLACFGFGDPEQGNLYLKNFLESRRTTSNQFYQAARTFLKLGFQGEALRLLEQSHGRDPDNEQVLALLIEVQMDLGLTFSLNEHLNHLFQLRRPAYGALENIREKLKSDRFILTPGRTGLLEQLERILREREAVDWEIWERTDPSSS